MGRKITILGMGISGQAAKFAPHLFEGTEVWGMNDGMTCYPHVGFDRWFELHGAKYIESWPNCKRFGGMVGYCEAIERIGVPVYTLEKLPVIENQVPYNQLDIAVHFANNHFDGTPSRMLALACYEHDALGMEVDYIQSFGIDMRDPQHAPQRPAWATWLTFAQCLGIQIGGTAWDFATVPETDAGIAVDRLKLGPMMQARERKESGASDLVIATHYTPGGMYEAGVNRLSEQCKALGLDFFARNIGTPQDGQDAHKFSCSNVVESIEICMAENNKPVLWIGADDEIIDRPTLPQGGWSIGVMRKNPEKLTDALPLGPYFAINNTSEAERVLNELHALTADVNDHRAVCAYVAKYDRMQGAGIAAIDDYIAGCIRLNPSRARTQAVTT